METRSFGYWLRTRRKGLDLTREGLAARVGCSAATIQKLEDEERRPSAQMVERLAEVFSIPPGEHSAFLRYARGELDSVIAESKVDSPWSTSAGKTRSNLPAPITPLVGRERELEAIRKYLTGADVRLSTLFGPPGIGKTRLGIEAARASLAAFPQGVFFVPLATLNDPALLAVTVAQALGYVGIRNISAEKQIEEGIGDYQMLMVLDNCEHLIEDVASFVSALLSACPNLSVLATSREPLRIAGEWLYPVPAFDVPGELSSFEGEAASGLVSSFPILTLFAERARAAQPDFRITAENVKAVSDICRQLDGLPLAVELVAPLVRSVSPQALLERLRDSYLLSADGLRAVPARQRSLNSAIDWSYRLLSEEEQNLFAFLSVFSGGFTLAAAEAVFTPVFSSKTASRLITSLVDKSLLQRTFPTNGEPRYAMLATIQEFAAQRLRETGRESAIRDWHLEYFLDLARQADQELRGPNQRKWLNRLDSMHDNLRAALDWAIGSGQTEKALHLVRSLWWFWSMRSEFSEGRQWVERVVAMSEAALFPDLYADVLTQLAHHTSLQIGSQEAKPSVAQALAIARKQEYPLTLANALMVFGLVLAIEGDFAAARAALEESIDRFRDLQDQWGQGLAVMSLGYVASREGVQETALVLIERALSVFRTIGDSYFQCVGLYEVGSLQAKQGDWEGGFGALRESLMLARGLGSRYEIASGLLRLAETEQHLGYPARAVRLYCAARNVYASIGAWHPQEDSQLEERLALCRGALGEPAYAISVDEGQTMTMAKALEYALEQSPHR